MRTVLRAAVVLQILVAHSFAADEPVKKIASAVDARYNSLKTFTADFVETYSGNSTSRS